MDTILTTELYQGLYEIKEYITQLETEDDQKDEIIDTINYLISELNKD